MAGMFGSTARLRDKSLADPQPYVPGYVDPNPTRTYEQALQDFGITDPLARLGLPRANPAPVAADAPAPFQRQPSLLGAGMGDNATYPGPASPNSDLPFTNAPELFQPRTVNGMMGRVATGPALDIPSNMFAAHIKPHFFDKEGTGTKIIQGLGELGLAFSASQGDPWALSQLRQRAQAAQDQREEVIWSRRHALKRQETLDDEKRKQLAPRYFSGKEDQLSYDPSTGKVTTIYDAPSDAEGYARTLGYQPGTQEWRNAVTDYTLKAYGPTAAGVRSDLLDQRLEGQVNLEGVRQGNRVALRGMPTYAQTHPRPSAHSGTQGPPRTTGNVYAPILAKMARGEPLTAGEQSVIGMYGRSNRGGGGHSSSGPTATGPGGKKVQWNGSAWVPVN
ncbi:hypothetical protein ACFSCW_03445 [Sphingomonas tabacisoli]|uniref:Uncharacterized protein n=1 Tax=Sphingomonas tabacisoli TaxID=2249466 RepID=A0ABW4I064_9SPHN